MILSRDELSPVSTSVYGDGSSSAVATTCGLTFVRTRGQWGMSAPTRSAFKAKFCRRVAELRDARGWTQQQMADALGIPLDAYKKYENRSPLPHYLVPRFCLLTDVDAELLFAIDRPLTRRPANR